MKNILFSLILFNNVTLNNLSVEGYELDFNPNIYEYHINIFDEDNLNIEYSTSENCYVSISGNGNFNKSDNIIKININNEKEYVIHAHKIIKTSIVNKPIKKEMSESKKEIIKLLVVIISLITCYSFYYLLFIFK